MENKYRHMRAAAHITQFGLDLVTPIILCVIAASFVKNKFDTGGWIVVLGVCLGVMAAMLNMKKFIDTVKREMGGNSDDEKRKN